MRLALEWICTYHRSLTQLKHRGNIILCTQIHSLTLVFILTKCSHCPSFIPWLSFYLAEQIYTSLLKVLVLKNRNFFLFSDLMKIIHVKLPHERRELFVFKIFGQNLVLKLILVFYNKGVALISPLDNVGVYGVFENAICFNDKVGDFWFFRVRLMLRLTFRLLLLWRQISQRL